MIMDSLPLPKELLTAARIFSKAGYQCWLVGGALRDGLSGRPTDDFDLATDAKPREVMRLFHRTIPTGVKHGTVTILLGKHQFETTTFRCDGSYSDGRRPDQVTYARDIREDLARRDFTINAMAWNLVNGGLFDPHDGKSDLNRRIIRAIGSPAARFNEDALRKIRACRFAAQLGFTIDTDTLKAINPSGLENLSVERIWDELKKILTAPQPSIAFRLFRQTGLLRELIPPLDRCADEALNNRERENMYEHGLAVCDAVPSADYTLRAAALFHDIGKKSDSNEKISCEACSADIAAQQLLHLKASKADTEKITRLIIHHGIHGCSEWSDADVRRFIIRAGKNILDDLLTLRKADISTYGANCPLKTEHIDELAKRIAEILRHGDPLTIKELKINGRQIMEELDMRPSSEIGMLQRYLLECVIENPPLNNYENLLELAKKYRRK
ncbi:MAG: hypothetical protein B0D92_08395 [Spirochaeta sp. LUC14_002_19_P3]|nr:MAG: hypothetical protein B0D92_08395 [Spirochaeta sp. LUC14_002_19_P3]